MRFGPSAVFVPLPSGQKHPPPKGWRNWKTADFEIALRRGEFSNRCNVGLVCGRASGGLVCIDCDTQEFAEAFAAANPELTGNTVRVTTSRGKHFWFQIEGAFPKTAKISGKSGLSVGEVRSEGSYAVVFGTHPDGTDYRVAGTSVAKTRWRNLRFPEGWSVPNELSLGGVTQKNYLRNTDLGNNGCLHLGNKECFGERTLEDLFYDRYVRPRIVIRPNGRNGALVAMVTFAVNAVHPAIVRRLARRLWEKGQGVWRDPLDRHKLETESAIKGCLRSFQENLSPSELSVYDSFEDETRRTLFRVVRSLHQKNGEFFLSYGEAANRSLCEKMQAYRILHNEFQKREILKMAKNGTKRKPGVAGRATEWLYLLR